MIRDIQGAGHVSPLKDADVAGVPGIVTAKRSTGFYMQDPAPDADPSTSEGIFVFTNSVPTVAVGDSVTVNGKVAEFRPTDLNGPNLTTTEIGGPTVVVVSSGNALPPATVVGTGGRVPPAATIDDDPTASVEDPAHVFDPAKNAIDFYESMEGMLVTVGGTTVVDGSSTSVSNGEIPVLPAGVATGLRSTRGAALVGPYVGGDVELSNANPGRVFLDDEVLKFGGGTMPAANVGDTIAAATGPLDYSFGNFKLEVTAAPVVTTVPLPREVGAAAPANGISVATYNVENLASTEAQSKFDGLAGQIVDNLHSPDIVVVEEIQDNDGTVTASPTAANLTWDKLIATIAAHGGPTYSYRQIDPVAGADGGAPGGNIRQGFLFRTDRGLAFVDRPGGDATTAAQVADVGGMPQLSVSPGRIAPNDGAWNASRKPLVGEFTYAGRTLFVVGNHFNSKGGDEPLFGRFQPPHRSSEVQRHQQATLVNDVRRPDHGDRPGRRRDRRRRLQRLRLQRDAARPRGHPAGQHVRHAAARGAVRLRVRGQRPDARPHPRVTGLEADRQGHVRRRPRQRRVRRPAQRSRSRSCCRSTSRRSPVGGTSPTAPTGCSTPACPTAAVGSRPAWCASCRWARRGSASASSPR